MQKFSFILTVMLLFLSSTAVSADIIWRTIQGDPDVDIDHVGNNVYQITISSFGGGGGEVIFYSDLNNIDTIEWLRITANDNAGGTVSIVPNPDNTQLLVKSVGEFSELGNANVVLQEMKVGTDIHEVRTSIIGPISAGQDIFGPITAIDPIVGNIGWVDAGRDMLANITTQTGRILFIDAGRNIGTEFTTVTISCKSHINRITGENVWADIDTTINGGSGLFGKFEASVGGFVGSLTAYKVLPLGDDFDIKIAGDFDGSMHFTTGIEDVNVIIGGSFLPGQNNDNEITTGSLGITGQVIINNDNNGGTWQGAVVVNGTTLSPIPEYDEAPSVLNYGAVGEVPFYLHDEGCVPTPGTYADPINVGTLFFYGPVIEIQFPSPDPTPVYIYRVTNGQTSGVNVQALYTFEVVPNVNGTHNTGLKMTRTDGSDAFESGYTYTLTRGTTLYCDVPILPMVRPYTYVITIN